MFSPRIHRCQTAPDPYESLGAGHPVYRRRTVSHKGQTHHLVRLPNMTVVFYIAGENPDF